MLGYLMLHFKAEWKDSIAYGQLRGTITSLTKAERRLDEVESKLGDLERLRNVEVRKRRNDAAQSPYEAGRIPFRMDTIRRRR